MGALDTYAGAARCPRCGEMHSISGQTKFFVPDFGGLFHRHFSPDMPQPLDFAPADLLRERVWDGEWWRVREAGEPGALNLLVNFDDLVSCVCGIPLAIVLRFRLESAAGAAGKATLTSIVLLDARAEEVPAAVDFASGELVVPWTSDYRAFKAELAALAAAPFPERAARLRATLAACFAPTEGARGDAG